MLSDAIHAMRERLSGTSLENHDVHGMALQLRIFEIEARNMETRIMSLTRRPHVALDGTLISGPVIDIKGGFDAF
ncbi:hypothetical protein [Pararhizobium gei]|uniref:hypothetical protein n=1 Tax=Pararhizobium gei TaxID=1395951 RepID=UPI0023D98D40|nr:hypothetical protein [Rhizobium gei]